MKTSTFLPLAHASRDHTRSLRTGRDQGRKQPFQPISACTEGSSGPTLELSHCLLKPCIPTPITDLWTSICRAFARPMIAPAAAIAFMRPISMPTRNPLTCDLTPFCDCEQVTNSYMKTTFAGRRAQSSIKGECCPVCRDCAALRFFPWPPPCASLARAYSLSLRKSTYGIHMQPPDSPEKPLCSMCVPCSLLMKVVEIAQDSLGCWCRLCTYVIRLVLRVRQRTLAMRIPTHRDAHDGVRLALPSRRSRD